MEQMTGPGDGARHDGQVAYNGRVVGLLFVLLFYLGDKTRVLIEENNILAVETGLKIFAGEDGAELAEQAQGVLNVNDVLEVAIDVTSQFSLNTGYINVELHEVTVKCVVSVVKQRVIDLAAERVNVDVKSVDDWLDVLKIVLFKGLELSNCAKQINQLANTAAEEFELPKDISFAEVKLAGLGHTLEALLSEIVLLDVGILERLATLKNHDKLIVGVLGLVPEAAVLKSGRDFNLRV